MEVQAQELIKQTKENSAMVQPMVNLLTELCSLYEELFVSLKSEKKCLILADIQALTENNKLKEALLYKIRALDRHREKLANEMAVKLGLKQEDARLLKLASKLTGEDSTALKTFHKKLSAVITQVTEYNSENSQYAESALKVFDGAFSEIKQTVTTKSTYGKQGKMAGSTETNAGNFVSKEA
jgi:hypothetical protein